MSITPNRDQFAALAAAASSDDEPVVMLNLLRFKDRATENTDESGAEAYRRYGDAATAMIEERGGKVLWAGRADQILIGNPDEPWDQVLLVEYPSRGAFIDMVTQPEYDKAHANRESGLERTIVVACTPRIDLIARAQGR